MKKLLFFLFMSLYATASQAQPDVYEHRNSGREITLSSRMLGGDISISASKSAPGFYSVYLEFDRGRGAIVNDVFKVIDTPEVELIRFKADSVHGVPGFRSTYFRGALNSKVKRDFTYRLPYADGQGKNVSKNRYDDSERPDNRRIDRIVYTFRADEGDDIYVMRKGTVIRIEDASWYIHGVADNNILRKANKAVSVEHADGTVAQYTNIQEGTTTVKIGDVVYPDTIIGNAGSLDEERYAIRVSLYYSTCPMRGVIPDFQKVEYHYLEPCFSTASGIVRLTDDTSPVCKADEALITAEMTKKQKKDRSKNK